MRFHHKTVLALALAFSLALSTPVVSEGNFQFTVEAEAGLKLAIGGYNSKGEQIFVEMVSRRETYDGKEVYVIRVGEEMIQTGQMVMWCVQDMKKKWTLPERLGKMPSDALCDRNPKDDGKGSYNFVVR